jgi:hypothetical protein
MRPETTPFAFRRIRAGCHKDAVDSAGAYGKIFAVFTQGEDHFGGIDE